MITLREASSGLLSAVEAAIESGDWKVDGSCDPTVEIIRLKNALAQPEQEFVGSCVTCGAPKGEWLVDGVNMSQERVDETAKCKHELDEPDIAVVDESGEGSNTMSWMLNLPLPVGTRLYTAPPKREWVGLTDEDKNKLVDAFYGTDIQRLEAIEAKLKEKNT